jgi:hypothetical protein
MVMDMLSQSTEKIAKEAAKQYAEILREHRQPTYYGRVVRETDEDGHPCVFLQYHFFYASQQRQGTTQYQKSSRYAPKSPENGG